MGLELETVHVFKTYNGNPILRDCSFTFASGRTYVLQGPNGSGKSTLFRLLALLERADRGKSVTGIMAALLKIAWLCGVALPWCSRAPAFSTPRFLKMWLMA